MTLALNERAHRIVDSMAAAAGELRIRVHSVGMARVLDLGVGSTEGGLRAGLLLARACMADLADIAIVPGRIGDVACPHVQVVTDHPVAACMASQYAGWQISVELPPGPEGKVKKYFAMGSGPMRAAAGRESLFEKIGFRESSPVAVGVLETGKLPTPEVVSWICERARVPATGLSLLVAPTASQAGGVQIVARSVETALHKLHELGFDLGRVVSAYGTAPLPPVARDDLAAIGRTNDAVLYGGRVTLWVRGDDQSLSAIGPRVPSSASPDHGAPFAEIFQRAGGDFYKIDPQLFSPAEVTFCNLDSGMSHPFGSIAPDVVRKSIGI
jgi:methenyltetrahydromethanopterin cyclohydrolase